MCANKVASKGKEQGEKKKRARPAEGCQAQSEFRHVDC
jgi:hypothetical protein